MADENWLKATGFLPKLYDSSQQDLALGHVLIFEDYLEEDKI